jgi:molecular chaperone GrpE
VETKLQEENKEAIIEENIEKTTQQAELEEQKEGLEGQKEETKEDKLLKQLEEKDMEIKKVNDKLLRSFAELENFKKRTEKEVREFKKYANEAIFFDMLTVVDNLERALYSVEDNVDEASGIREGVELTLKELLKTFEKHGVTQIKALDEQFDPAFHQAMMKEESEEHPENTVINEFQKGYVFKERLLRPAMVVVSVKNEKENK